MPATQFDVFLSHNSRDKPAVERIAVLLKEAGVEPWLDRWQLVGGDRWQQALGDALRASAACAVFYGGHGLGDWQQPELEVAQDRATKDSDFRLIPVLLPGTPEQFDPTMLPPFLSMLMWVDLRQGIDDPAGLAELTAAVRGVRETLEGLPASGVASDAPPYRGLRTFDEDDAEFFFGREADVQRLLEKLKGSRFLAVVGPSGSGKSSLVRAGLLPALRRNGLPRSQHWTVCVFKPDVHPLTSLAAYLGQLGHQAAMQQTIDQLQADPRTLHLAASLGFIDRPVEDRLLLVVDQFEEVFTLCRDEEERAAFIANLLYAAAVPDGRCGVMLTLRADFYPRCAAHPELASRLSADQYLVSPLVGHGLRDAITKPAARVGLGFEPGLVERIVQEVQSQPGALPLLQHALLELWERRDRRRRKLTVAAYEEIEGVAGALAKHADASFAALTPEQQAITRRAMLRLTQPGEGTEDTRRRAEMKELETRPEEHDQVEQVVDALVKARLLTTSGDEQTGAQWVDVAHEALIRGWPRLRQWLEEDRQGLLVHRRLTEAAQGWQRCEYDPDLLYRGARLAEAQALADRQGEVLNERERQFLAESAALRAREIAAVEEARRARERLRRRVMAGLATFAVVALVLAGFAGWQWGEARTSETEALGAQAAEATAAALADAEAAAARTAEAEARLQADAAQRAESTAEAEAARAASAAATAQAAEADAQTQARIAADAQSTAEAEAARAEEQARVALPRQLAAQSRVLGDEPDLALLLAAQAYELAPDELEVWRSLFAATHAQPQLERLLRGSVGPSIALAFSPDGQMLASGGWDGMIRRWNPHTGAAVSDPIATDHGAVYDLAFRLDGKQLAVAMWDVLQLWDPVTGAAMATITSAHGGIIQVAYSPKGDVLASGTANGTIELWDPVTGAAVGPAFGTLGGHEGQIQSLAFSPDGATLVSAGTDDPIVDFWTLRETGGRRKEELETGQGSVRDVRFSPDGSLLATAGTDGTIRLWDAATRVPIGEPLAGHEDDVERVAFSPDGDVLYSGGADGTIRQWDVATRQPLGTPIDAGQGLRVELALSPDGATLASAEINGVIRLWDMAAPEPGLFSTLHGHEAAPSAVASSADGETIATGDDEGTMVLWDAATGAQRGQPLRGHIDRITALDFGRDDLLASASADGMVRLWDIATGEPRRVPLLGHVGAVTAVAFSPTRDLLATGGEDGTVRLWRPSDGGAVGAPLKTSGHVRSINFTPDGTVLSAADDSGAIHLWNAESHEPVLEAPIQTGQGGVSGVCFVREGTGLASAGTDGTIRYWDAADGAAVGDAVTAHEGAVAQLVCAPDGVHLATAGEHGSVRLWRVGGPTSAADVFPANDAGAQPLTFSHDGSQLAFLSSEGSNQASVNLWDVGEGAFLRSFPILQVLIDAALSANGATVVAGGEDGRVTVWDAATGTLRAEQRLPEGEGLPRVAVSSDGSRIAIAGFSDTIDTIHLWDGDSARAVGAPLGHHDGDVVALSFSPDGTLLASGAADGTVRLWDTKTGEQRGEVNITDETGSLGFTNVESLAFNRDGTLLAMSDWVASVLWDVELAGFTGDWFSEISGVIRHQAFSPDDRLLVAGSSAGEVLIWNLATDPPVVERLSVLPGSISALTINRDGSLLAVASSTGAIAVWDLSGNTPAAIGHIQGADSWIWSLSFASDGTSLIALDDIGVVSLWDLSPASWQLRACTIANRNLTREEWERYIPGLPYQATCPNLPLPADLSVATPVGERVVAGGAVSATPAVPTGTA